MTDPVTRPPATDEVPQDAPAASPQAVAALSDMETDWRRLDPRMLLVHLVQETFRLLPVLFGIIILGRSSDSGQNWFEWVFIPLVVGVVLLRYLTTRYRITNGQIELRKGLLNKQILATPADRVRTVDVTSSPIHRVLGLGKVELGTAGVGHGDRLVLDALTLPEARHLREELIHLRQVRSAPAATTGIPAGPSAPPPTGEPYAIQPPVTAPAGRTGGRHRDRAAPARPAMGPLCAGDDDRGRVGAGDLRLREPVHHPRPGARASSPRRSTGSATTRGGSTRSSGSSRCSSSSPCWR